MFAGIEERMIKEIDSLGTIDNEVHFKVVAPPERITQSGSRCPVARPLPSLGRVRVAHRHAPDLLQGFSLADLRIG